MAHLHKQLHTQGIDRLVTVVSKQTVQNVPIFSVRVRDGYHQPWYSLERYGSRLLAKRLEAYLARRPHLHAAHPRNRANQLLKRLRGFREWSALMPGALALQPIHDPSQKSLPGGPKLDFLTRRLFRHGLDPVGVRTRTLVGGWLAHQYVAGRPSRELHWLSLAGGTAAPALLMITASGASKQQVFYTNIDLDNAALTIAKRLVAHEGLVASRTQLIEADILSDATLKRHATPSSTDIIDLMGILEYLDDTSAASLLGRAYQALKPGGRIIAGNMRSDHPQLNLHKRGVGWPGVIPRSVEEIIGLCTKADLPMGHLAIFQPKDGVYNVLSLEHP